MIHGLRRSIRRAGFTLALLPGLALTPGFVHAGMGLMTLEPQPPSSSRVTLYYPSAQADRPHPVGRGHITLQVAADAAPQPGNGALVVLSHGSGGTPWVHADLARRLVEAGFVVAMPWHQGDNAADSGEPGPVSWARRPAEVSAAIDTVAADARFAALLQFERVGVYGQSAGGHTALSMAGGEWSPARFAEHCQAHIADDFHACVGLALRLSGGWADRLKQWAARWVLRLRFRDATLQAHHDPRVAAVVAGNPLASDFDPASLARPRVPLGLVTTRQDRWLVPRFHGDRVLAACQPRCEHLMDLPDGGHGALLSPLPPGLTGLVGELLGDPPGFDRTVLALLDGRIVAFMQRHLLR
ncbi:alpha/beta hydrolase family protein [Pseudorhodoferax sp.]|uniref:alpha/beta hydrolase family protein n=1 Tax=Pseudorhodoferax sp. TaxID=1993553 RepID=UPI002DD679E6|nr:dienelactone hydrolase [Pseudorhodoferax sp.]